MANFSITQLGEVDRFQASNKKVMLIVSEAPETVSAELEAHLRKEPTQSTLIFLDLTQLKDPFGGLLEESLNENQLKELYEGNGKFLFILRNYEKCIDHRPENIYLKNRLERCFNIKLVFICESSVLNLRTNYRILFASYYKGKCEFSLFEEITLIQKLNTTEPTHKEVVPDSYWNHFLTGSDFELESRVNINIVEKLENHPLNKQLIVTRPLEIKYRAQKILNFDSDKLETDAFTWKQLLFLFLKYSKEVEILKVGAANAITILNSARITFSGMDLSHIKIPHAVLDGAVFHGSNLQLSNCTAVRFKDAFLGEAIFSNAILSNTEFVTLPYLSPETGSGGHNMVMCSPNSQWIIAANGGIDVWDAKKFIKKYTLAGHKLDIGWSGNIILRFSADSERLAFASIQGRVKIFNLQDGSVSYEKQISDQRFWGMCFTEDHQHLVTASHQEPVNITVWHLLENEILNLRRTVSEHQSLVSHICLSQTEHDLFTVDSDGKVIVWEVGSLTPKQILDTGIESVRKLHLSVDELLFFINEDGNVYCWDYQRETEPNLILECAESCSCAAISSDTKQLAICDENIAIIYDLTSGKPIRSFRGHTDDIRGVTFDPFDNFLLTTSCDDCTVRFWSLKPDQSLRDFGQDHAPVKKSCFSKDNRTLLALTMTGIVQVLDKKTGCIIRLLGLTNVVDVSGSFLVSISDDRVMSFFDIQKNALCYTINFSEELTFRAMRFSLDNLFFAASAQEKDLIAVMNLSNGHEIMISQQFLGSIISISFDAKNRYLFVGTSSPESVYIYNLISGDVEHRFTYDQRSLLGLKGIDSSSCGKYLAAYGDGSRGYIYVGDIDNKIQFVLENQRAELYGGSISAIKFTSQAACLITARDNNTLAIWDLEKRLIVQMITGCTMPPVFLDLDSAGDYLVAGHEQDSLRLWKKQKNERECSYLLQWQNPTRFFCNNAKLDGVEGISFFNAPLLKQHGAQMDDEDESTESESIELNEEGRPGLFTCCNLS